jgi:hypothetical protein
VISNPPRKREDSEGHAATPPLLFTFLAKKSARRLSTFKKEKNRQI